MTGVQTCALPISPAAITELVAAEKWTELNDRFYKRIEFGTGGLRGRTIGRVVTAAERGDATPGGPPQHPCVGSAAMNRANLRAAVLGVVAYAQRSLAEQGRADERVRVVFSHDTRFFSRDFAEFAAQTAADAGCEALIFDGPRSTPQLSFAVRRERCHAGGMLTASHNPSHDNGFKVYFEDGAQIATPHDAGVVAEAARIAAGGEAPRVQGGDGGSVRIIGPDNDTAYLEAVAGSVAEPDALRARAPRLPIAFTALHGTGGVHIPALLRDWGFPVHEVQEQAAPDGAFPTVASPNPENEAAMERVLALGEATDSALAIGTDPDCDRLSAAARDAGGALRLLTGNQIAALIAWARLSALERAGILTDANRERATLVKTFVTTPLLEAVATRFGVRCVNTLTGFKYIGAKLLKYERALPPELREKYGSLSVPEARAAQLAHGTFYVFGGEESYGTLAGDYARDKDGNGAALALAEAAAAAAAQGRTLWGQLNVIQSECGAHAEALHSLVFEGAAGAAQIAALAESLLADPPAELDGVQVRRARNFAAEDLHDEEGDPLPKERMLYADLADGRAFAARPSGTEPKIKFYLFARRRPAEGHGFTPEELAAAQRGAQADIQRLWAALEADIQRRTG